ncbi:hypothetical protein EMIHUDRAFT_227933 [Emiliania huxleyi CCMP1516]|uniref:DUF676 domain-containing protein n=2 Tax=Emiliania huxleyi TaxID=2903 RepID=A0A0D3KGP2_EMIH1|nr:hypothetical protein EMIHUDRAFT_227933 [Emiliania huxleyi CCMP1516]EOD34927.1 hypothetical protein EMIHUDRAFT_227933 [Emiliania huxleyi CCMP1516]|eukprot:XP_005787356.1 hypothetical protein EMIHUDRAFT_227933 [Emiliania huxleyi CCMP1516]
MAASGVELGALPSAYEELGENSARTPFDDNADPAVIALEQTVADLLNRRRPCHHSPVIVAVQLLLLGCAVLLLALPFALLVCLVRLLPWLPLPSSLPHSTETAGLDWGELHCGLWWASGGWDPAQPTVVYVHGWEPGTTARGFRETFNWRRNVKQPSLGVKGERVPDIDAAELWAARGWNVALFYWNQCVADQLASALLPLWRAAYGGGPSSSSSPLRLVGHSLGAQLVLEAVGRLVERQPPKGRRHLHLAEVSMQEAPLRIALLDPFFSPGAKQYLPRQTSPAARGVANLSAALRSLPHLPVELYRASILGDPPLCAALLPHLGDPTPQLHELAAFGYVVPPGVHPLSPRARHIAAVGLYFLSIAHEEDALTPWEGRMHPRAHDGLICERMVAQTIRSQSAQRAAPQPLQPATPASLLAFLSRADRDGNLSDDRGSVDSKTELLERKDSVQEFDDAPHDAVKLDLAGCFADPSVLDPSPPEHRGPGAVAGASVSGLVVDVV